MLRLHRPLLLAASLALAVAAPALGQKIKIETKKDEKANFAAIKTYAWLPPAPMVQSTAPDSVRNPTLSQDALGPPLVAAVDRQLAARGFVQAPADKADVHVAYMAALTVGFNQSYLGEHYGYITGWGSPIAPGLAPSTQVEVFEKGTVLVDVVDPKEKRAIWRGSAQTQIDHEKTLDARIKRINEATERMFEKFPIPPQKKK